MAKISQRHTCKKYDRQILEKLVKKNILKIESFTKIYAETSAVQDLSLEVSEGEIYGFLGPNGAGKST